MGAPPTVNPLCKKLLDTSKILAEMPPQEPVDDKQAKSLSSNSPEVSAQAAPPGLKKSSSAKVEEAPEVEEKEKKTESEPKSGDINPAEEKTKVTEEDEKSKEISEDEEKDSKGGGIDADAEPLVGVEEKGKDKDEAVVE